MQSYGEDLTVHLWGTGGMNDQIRRPRAGLISAAFDDVFFDLLGPAARGAAPGKQTEMATCACPAAALAAGRRWAARLALPW